MTSKETLKSLKKIRTKIKKGLPKKIKLEKLNAKLATRLNEQAQEAVQKATRTAQVATEAAKSSLDQVLLGLEHRGLNIKESQDLAIRVGRKVLERAEAIRAQIAENPLSPSWLKEVRLKCADQAMATDTTAVSTEIPSTTSAPAAGMAEPAHGDRAAANLAAEAYDNFDDEAAGIDADETAAEKPARKTKRAAAGTRKASGAAARATK